MVEHFLPSSPSSSDGSISSDPDQIYCDEDVDWTVELPEELETAELPFQTMLDRIYS
jgi:hypothetical protein